MTQFVTLQPVSGIEIDRREMRRHDALIALQHHQIEGGAGYVITNGHIIAKAPVHLSALHETAMSASGAKALTEHMMRRYAIGRAERCLNDPRRSISKPGAITPRS